MNVVKPSELIILEFVSYASVPFKTEIYAENLSIDWGDGNKMRYDPETVYFPIKYTYPTTGLRQIKISATSISYLKVNHSGLTRLILSNCTTLEYLNCAGNELHELHLENCCHLEELYCNSNNLSQLYFPAQNRITHLNLSYNLFHKLTLGNCHSLQNFYCSHCRLHELNLESCSSVNNLNISHNFLTPVSLNRIFENLPEKNPTDYATLYYAGNPGNFSSNTALLFSKGWF